MTPSISLSPRYRLDDESPWLLGIDPTRHYWIAVNGGDPATATNAIAIPGLIGSSIDQFKQLIREFRALQPDESMQLRRVIGGCTIYCVSSNCYAVEIQDASAVWHLFDRETLESLLMTAHPDWQCAPRDIELGRQMLMRSLEQSLVA